MSEAARETRQRSVPFYLTKNPNADKGLNAIDFSVAKAFLAKWPKTHKFCIKHKGFFYHHRSRTAVLNIIKNGWGGEVEVWAYVNPQKPVAEKTQWGYRTKWVCASHNAFVIDIDSTHKLLDFKDKMELMYHAMQRAGLAYSNWFIVKTSTARWHLVCAPTEAVAARFSQEDIVRWVTKIPSRIEASKALELFKTNPGEFDAYVKDGGIDGNYLRQNYGAHKFRVPGFFNLNREDTFTKNRPYKYFMCMTDLLTSEEDFNNSNSTGQIQEAQKLLIEFEQQKQLTKETKKAEEKIDRLVAKQISEKSKKHNAMLHNPTVKEIKKAIRPIVGQRAFGMACFLFDNLSFLKKKDFTITQTILAEKLKISRSHVSVMLKKLKEAGFLTQEKGGYYNYDEKRGKRVSKVYGMGPALAKITDNSTYEHAVVEKIKEDLGNEYVRGDSNEQYMRDIRGLYYMGATPEVAYEILRIKALTHKPIQDKCSLRSIRNAFANWEMKSMAIKFQNKKFRRRTPLTVDFTELLEG